MQTLILVLSLSLSEINKRGRGVCVVFGAGVKGGSHIMVFI